MPRIPHPFRVDTTNAPLMRAQFAAFTKQVPLLYLILSANATTLSFAFWDIAPPILTIGVPVALVTACMIRLVVWSKSRNEQLSDAAVVKRLKGVIRIGVALGILFLGWALALFPYGSARAQDQVAFFVAVTVISGIFCLVHLRAAALMLTAIIAAPFTVFLLCTNDTNLMAMGVNLGLLCVAMVYILCVNSRDFARLVDRQIEAKRLSDENARLAHVDPLTGLPNRRQFFRELDRRLEASQAGRTAFIVGVIDLDGFKPVNDRFGHVIGDGVLTEAGERLRTIAGDTLFISRIGGDEFGIILDGGRDEADLLALGERICAILQVPFDILGVVANISGSIGFAAFPEAGETAKTLYEHADYSLYQAKTRHRGRPVLFSKAHETEIRTNTVTERCLRNADLEAEMSLAFQPLFDVAANRPVAFEALARWHSPELGNVSPGVFVPIAERTELINEITRCLLKKALRTASDWPEDIRLSFNLSARDIGSREAILQIISIISAGPIAPARIDLEITETSVMGDFDQAIASLSALKALGVKIALDDFGTGYSSLSHVHRLPLDKIKVDRSFVQDIETKAVSHSLVSSVIHLCNNLNIGCVIEGMETANQARILRELGCNTMQGYYFSKPVPPENVLALLERASASGCSQLALAFERPAAALRSA